MPGRVISGRTVDRLLSTTGRRYDLVLALIPLAFVAGGTIAAALGVDPEIGIRGGSVVALATTGYALFGLSPTKDA
jgi:hypothetical protein